MTDATATLTDFATLAFVIAHGADADLDTREMDILTERVDSLSRTLMQKSLGEAKLGTILQEATRQYHELAIADVNTVLDRLGRSLDPEQRAQVYAAFVEVAAADGMMHMMEQTLLRHIASAWHLD